MIDNNVLVRKGECSSGDELYHLTVLKKLETMDELILNPVVWALMQGRAARIEKDDNFRFRLYLQKLAQKPSSESKSSLSE